MADDKTISKKDFKAMLAAAAKEIKLTMPRPVSQLLKGTEAITFEEAARAALAVFRLVEKDMAYPQEYIAFLLENGLTDRMRVSLGDYLATGDAEALISNLMDYKKLNAVEYYEEDADEQQQQIMPKICYCMSPPVFFDAAESAAPSATFSSPSIPDLGGFAETPNTESYHHSEGNVFKKASLSPLSTIALTSNTASYGNLRRFIVRGQKIPADAIRTEELINYFSYDYPQPKKGEDFSLITEIAPCPWNEKNKLALVALRGREMGKRPKNNLVFLVDVSGSMDEPDKLPLIKRALSMLVERLAPTDTVSLVTYANGVSVPLDGEKAANKERIKAAFYALRADGCTFGEGGLEEAYKIAAKHKVKGNNRIILCSDGDFNAGRSSEEEMLEFVEEKRVFGVFLSVLGFGMGNYKDSMMEVLADKGKGSYAYIDNIREAKKTLVDDMTKTIFAIAKDAKLQVEFNPVVVSEYRLIGYENRRLKAEDFDNDAKDAGEVGTGGTITALYELVLADGMVENKSLRYSKADSENTEPFYVKIRYKEPDGETSKLIEKAAALSDVPPSENMRWASAVAELGLLLTDSPFKGTANFDSVLNLAKSAVGIDTFYLRQEFIQLTDLLRFTYAL